MTTNGRNKTIAFLITIIMTLFAGIAAFNYWVVVPSLADNIINNDKKNTEQHINIREVMIERDEKIVEKMEVVKDIVMDIRVEQMEQMTILKRLDR